MFQMNDSSLIMLRSRVMSMLFVQRMPHNKLTAKERDV
jgi:hypothetical protein